MAAWPQSGLGKLLSANELWWPSVQFQERKTFHAQYLSKSPVSCALRLQCLPSLLPWPIRWRYTYLLQPIFVVRLWSSLEKRAQLSSRRTLADVHAHELSRSLA